MDSSARKMFVAALGCALCAHAVLAAAPAAGVCIPSSLVPGGCLVSIGSGVQMAYSLVPPSSIAIALTAQTQGYISVSFTPGSYHMSPADAVFGWIENGQATVAAYQVNGYSTSDITLDSSVSLTNTSVTQSGGYTTITFTRPLAAGRYHIDPVAMSYDVAVGSSPGLVKHSSASSGIANLDTGLVTITSIDPRDKYWITHGILMIFAWALLVPHAIGFAMFKVKWSAIFKRDAMWFHVHRAVQFVALVSHVISMIIALTKFGNFIEDGTMNAHSALAWIVTALLGIQWLVALFLRPNKTAPRRPLWNLAHFSTARIMIAAALANISIGIYLYNRKTNRLLMPLGAWIGVFLVCLASAAVHFGWLALRSSPPPKEEGANVELPPGQPQAKFADQADNLSTP